MALGKLQFEGSSALRTQAEVVTEFDRELEDLVCMMHETMQLYDGVGLAAPQIGISKQVVTFSFEPFVMINPEIMETGGTQILREGCLSFPNLFFDIERPKKVLVAWEDTNGVSHIQEFEGLEATAIQHEIDHLNGKLFIDHVSGMKVLMEKKKLAAKRKGPKR